MRNPIKLQIKTTFNNRFNCQKFPDENITLNWDDIRALDWIHHTEIAEIDCAIIWG